MTFPSFGGIASGALSGIAHQLVQAVSGFYVGNPVIDGIMRIPALLVSGSATNSANFGF